jgi:hypothetical protein
MKLLHVRRNKWNNPYMPLTMRANEKFAARVDELERLLQEQVQRAVLAENRLENGDAEER